MAGAKILIGITAAALTCAIVQGVVVAQQSAPKEAAESRAEKFSSKYGSHLEPILSKISATPEQKEKITAIVAAYYPKIEPLRQEYREKSQEFISFIVNGQSAERVMARQGELNRLYSAIVTQYSLMRLEIRRLLTPDQRVLFEEYRRKQGWSVSSK